MICSREMLIGCYNGRPRQRYDTPCLRLSRVAGMRRSTKLRFTGLRLGKRRQRRASPSSNTPRRSKKLDSLGGFRMQLLWCLCLPLRGVSAEIFRHLNLERQKLPRHRRTQNSRSRNRPPPPNQTPPKPRRPPSPANEAQPNKAPHDDHYQPFQ